MERGVPERGNQSLDDFWRKVESIDDNGGHYVLDMVHEAYEHADECSPDEEERRIDLNLAD